MFEPVLFELDLGRLLIRIIRADGLDELAVARVARVGGDHVVKRHFFRARARKTKNNGHSLLQFEEGDSLYVPVAGVVKDDTLASWPQAAAMSRPRFLRTKAAMCPSARIWRNASARSSPVLSKPSPGFSL